MKNKQKNEFIEKNGYRFVGWYIDPERRKRINPGGVLPGVVTLYDKWIPVLYPVRYHCNGGVNARKNPKKVSVVSESFPLFPAHKKGKKFVTWMLDGKVVDVLPANIGHPVDLYAIYSDFDVIHFDSMGGGKIEPKICNQDGLIESFRPPVRMGCQFAGWFMDKEYQKPFYLDQPVHDSYTVYAKWDVTYYEITYDCQGGLSSRKNPKSYCYDSEAIVLRPAMKKGYEFLGWYDTRGNQIEEIPTHSLGKWHLTARFQKL